MAKIPGRRRKNIRARQRQFTVHVSKFRVGMKVSAAIFLLILVGFFSRGNTFAGIIFVLIAVVQIVFGYFWICDVGRVVIQVEPNGLRYLERFVEWEEISQIELIRRSRTRDKLLVTLHSGSTFTIRDDLFDMSMEELAHALRKRI